MTVAPFAKGSGRSPEPLSLRRRLFVRAMTSLRPSNGLLPASENFEMSNYTEEFQTI
jgi:hypothetical protein